MSTKTLKRAIDTILTKDQDPNQKILLEHHRAEAARKNASFQNFGWSKTENGIVSKTTKGMLETEMDLATGKISHDWS